MSNLYRTARWKRKHTVIMKRDGYLCRECLRFGKRVAARQVHHIIPITLCMAIASFLVWLDDNLISLCNECHDAMHDRRRNSLTVRGKKLLRRTKGLKGYWWLAN